MQRQKSAMNNYWIGILLALAITGISGCATMSADECANSDWTAVGFEDGASGYPSSRFGDHRKACAKHGITAEFQVYQDGREQGLVEYCQPNRGFSVGSAGGQYNSVCASHLEPGFLNGYNAGYQLYSLRSDVKKISAQIHAKEHELDEIEEDMGSMEAALISDETSKEDRVLLLKDIKELSELTGQVETEIELLIEARAQASAELRHFEESLATNGY